VCHLDYAAGNRVRVRRRLHLTRSSQQAAIEQQLSGKKRL
jgi:hypothetical protein